MSFFTRCISGNSLKGMAREDDEDGGSDIPTPNDTAHGGSKFSSYSWRRLSAKSRSSLNSPKKPHTPPLSATSVDGTGPPRASMEPVMERTRSALTDLEAVKFLVEDWSHKHWRPATPQDQQRFDRLEQSDIKPLVALGEGAYGSVNLCRIAVSNSTGGPNSPLTGHGFPSPFGDVRAQAQRETMSASGAAALAPRGSHRHSRSIPGGIPSLTLELNANGPQATAGSAAAALDSLAPSVALPTGSERPSASSQGNDAAASSAASPAASGSGANPVPEAVKSELPAGEGAVQDGSSGDDSGYGVMQPASSVNDPQLIVAVKRVPLGWNQERELMQLHRCQQCPFIVRLFGFVDDGSEHCNYVMEWAEGGDLGVMLSSLKTRRGANKQRLLMSEASARYYLGCLLLALEFLHANGLLHRDIKPSNLLLTSDGTAKLADLGFTVALDVNGVTVGCCGTTGYIAPEVYSYGSAKSRMAYGVPADIWSAGATLYQMLTGQVVTEEPAEVLKKGWRPPSHPRFSHHLQDLLNRLLAVKPNARPQSAASVMRHPWFSGFDWQALREGRMKAPYVPSERRRKAQAHALMQPETQHPGAAPSSSGIAAAAASSTIAGSSSGGALSSTSLSAGGADSHSHAGADVAVGPPTTCPGGQRLEPVMEGVSSPRADSGQQLVVQRSALSGQGEGSVKRGREGLIRDGASFETALGSVSTVEVKGVGEDASAAVAQAAAAAGVSTTRSNRGGHGHAHGHAHGHVRFAVGVAECA